MKQQVRSTPHGKTLVIEGFDPIETAPGLTKKGIMGLDAIILKNCLNSGQDALIIKSDNEFILEEMNLDNSLKLNLEQLVRNWISLTVNEKKTHVSVKHQ